MGALVLLLLGGVLVAVEPGPCEPPFDSQSYRCRVVADPSLSLPPVEARPAPGYVDRSICNMGHFRGVYEALCARERGPDVR